MSYLYAQNHDPEYYESHYHLTNCGSYAFNITSWYDADKYFEEEVGDVESWVRIMAIDYDDEELSDFYAKAVAANVLTDFDGEIRICNDFVSVEPDEELIAMRVFVNYDESWDMADFDYHFKVYRNDGWYEKLGAMPVEKTSLKEWDYGDLNYISDVYFFAHKIS